MQQQGAAKGAANGGAANGGGIPGLQYAGAMRGRPGARRSSKMKAAGANMSSAAGLATNTTVKANKLNTRSLDEMLQFIEGVD